MNSIPLAETFSRSFLLFMISSIRSFQILISFFSIKKIFLLSIYFSGSQKPLVFVINTGVPEEID